MSANLPRRGFLRQLVTLPLIGGGVTLTGQPTAVAEPADFDTLCEYWSWLSHERQILTSELFHDYDVVNRIEMENLCGRPVRDFHRKRDFRFPRIGQPTDVPMPSTRATLVMSTAGFDWREAER